MAIDAIERGVGRRFHARAVAAHPLVTDDLGTQGDGNLQYKSM